MCVHIFVCVYVCVCVCVYVCVCVCGRACVHPSLYYSTPPFLQSSTRRSAKVSLSTADRGGHLASEQKQWFILKCFIYIFKKKIWMLGLNQGHSFKRLECFQRPCIFVLHDKK